MLLEVASKELLLPIPYLQWLASVADHRYFKLTATRKNGLAIRTIAKSRTVFHPSKELKGIQRWIANRVFADLPVHDAVHSYRKGRSIGTNAAVHRTSRYFLRLDIKKYFPSITADDIIKFLIATGTVSGFSPQDFEFVSAIVSRFGRLPIGSPASPTISNAICFAMDEELQKLADNLDCKYTRYADDLVFSSQEPGRLNIIESKAQSILDGLNWPRGLRLNQKKTIYSSRKRRVKVTGLVVTPTKQLSVGRGLKRRIRSLVYKSGQLSPKERTELAGYISYINSIEPGFIDRLYIKYGPAVMAGIVKRRVTST